MQQKKIVWSWLKFVLMGPLSLTAKELEKSRKQSNRKSANDFSTFGLIKAGRANAHPAHPAIIQ